MGEPFRSNSRDDDTLADWFEQADKNHDGRLTLEEMQADAERFFATLDVNHDGEIDPDEITRYENVVAPETRAGEHFASLLEEGGQGDERPRGGRDGRRHGEGGPSPRFVRGGDDQHQGAGRFGLLDLPEPVVSADADFNRGVSLSEFRQAAVQRFLALDLDHHGFLTLASLESIRPAPPPMPNAPEKSHEADESALPPGL
jgi:Ca2+-binding EF-hand superfamily protein